MNQSTGLVSRFHALIRAFLPLFFAGFASMLQAQDPQQEPPLGPIPYRVDRNVFIKMRDGIRLAADLYLPSSDAASRAPVVLMRTPYGNIPGHSYYEAPAAFFASHGYAVAVQDKRGKFRSEGVYVAEGGDAEDGYDTVDWLSKRPWSNGKIGTYGCSYAGDIQVILAKTKHPALKAMIPQGSSGVAGSVAGMYRYFAGRIGGAVELAAYVGWFAENGQKATPHLSPDLDHADYSAAYDRYAQPARPVIIDYQRAWNHLPLRDALRDQGFAFTDFEDNVTKAPGDAYWSTLPYMTDEYTSDVPALFVNSWYDMGADVTLMEFNHFRAHSVSEVARQNQYAIISPTVHCASEREEAVDAKVGSRPIGDTRFDYWQTYLTWFDHWLKDDPAAQKQVAGWPHLRYFVMGKGIWNSADTWPVKGARPYTLYLSSAKGANSLFGDGRLTPNRISDRSSPFDSFTYDPGNPVPSLGGQMCCTGTADSIPGSQDQRVIEARHDVLVYTTEALPAGIEATGPVEIVLYGSSTAVDTDFTAKLIDVYPDGRAFNVLETVLRARYRDGQEKEVWMKQGEVYEMHIPMLATSNYFGIGHRVRIEVSSSNFPRFDRNLNVGGNNAEATRWVTAKNTIHHSANYPSRLVLTVAGNE
jgi:putative CocE/NonD family hydrolase